jgi:hypothetical protein
MDLYSSSTIMSNISAGAGKPSTGLLKFSADETGRFFSHATRVSAIETNVFEL